LSILTKLENLEFEDLNAWGKCSKLRDKRSRGGREVGRGGREGERKKIRREN
jgi:hypothetical protein